MKVTIYEDPITRSKPEGLATLLRRVEDVDGGLLERWVVKFPGDAPVERWVHRDTIKKEV